jgi:hypothetical protein
VFWGVAVLRSALSPGSQRRLQPLDSRVVDDHSRLALSVAVTKACRL